MGKMKENKGITLIALIITIVVLLIIAGISINMGITGADQAARNKLFSELGIVQHAIVERYTKYKLTKDESLLVGTKQEIPPIAPEGKTWQKSTGYYELTPNDLKQLGITDAQDTYIVNYETSEVYNITVKKVKTDDGYEVLYKDL